MANENGNPKETPVPKLSVEKSPAPRPESKPEAAESFPVETVEKKNNLMANVRDELKKQRPLVTPRKMAGAESINLPVAVREMGVNWIEIKAMGKSMNDLLGKEDEPAATWEDITSLKPADPDLYFGIPMVASVVAHRENSSIPVLSPTEEQIKKLKPWLETVSNFVGKISPTLQNKFNGLIERKGGEIVQATGQEVADLANVIGEIKNPKQQFLSELTYLYTQLSSSQMEPDFLGMEQEMTIERKIEVLMETFYNLRYRESWEAPAWIDRKKLPLSSTLLPRLGIPPYDLNAGEKSVAASELMQGFETFLKTKVARVNPAPIPTSLNLLDVRTWQRALVETFASDRLERVKEHLPDLLEHAYQSLPENGQLVKGKIYEIATDIVILHREGYSPHEIADYMFARDISALPYKPVTS